MQILQPFSGSAQQYAEEVSTPDRYRPDHCPQCPALQPLIAHGFYSRTLVEAGFDGSIRVRRYLCRSCRRTVSLLPHVAGLRLRCLSAKRPSRQRRGRAACVRLLASTCGGFACGACW